MNTPYENPLDSFFSYLENERRYSINTLTAYKNDIDCFKVFLEQEEFGTFLEVTPRIAEFYSGFLRDKYTPRSIARKVSSLKTMYNYFTNVLKYTDENPFKGIVLPKVEKKLPKFIYDEEINEFLHSIEEDTPSGKRDALIFNLLSGSGLRVSELTGIKMEDVNINEREILIHGKGAKDRIVPFNIATRDKFRNYIILARPTFLSRSSNLDNNYVFLNFKGGTLTARGVRDILERVLLKTSSTLKVSPHTFRHSFATHLLNNGMDVRMVQELLGHTNLSTTQVYTKLSRESLQEAYNKAHPKGKDRKDD